MQQSIYYIKFALQFADMQITELVNIFNRRLVIVAGQVCVPIMIRLSLTSFSGAALTPHVYMMGMLSASPTLSRMILTTTSLFSQTKPYSKIR